jgi:hypothetical protein
MSQPTDTSSVIVRKRPSEEEDGDDDDTRAKKATPVSSTTTGHGTLHLVCVPIVSTKEDDEDDDDSTTIQIGLWFPNEYTRNDLAAVPPPEFVTDNESYADIAEGDSYARLASFIGIVVDTLKPGFRVYEEIEQDEAVDDVEPNDPRVHIRVVDLTGKTRPPVDGRSEPRVVYGPACFPFPRIPYVPGSATELPWSPGYDKLGSEQAVEDSVRWCLYDQPLEDRRYNRGDYMHTIGVMGGVDFEKVIATLLRGRTYTTTITSTLKTGERLVQIRFRPTDAERAADPRLG